MKKWIAYFALAVIVTAFSLGYLIGRERRCELLEWYPLQLERLAEGNHSYSDEMVRNVVKLYAYHHEKELAFRQMDEVWRVDSAYWPVLYCRGYLLYHEWKEVPAIEYYERALAANSDCEVFDAGGGNYFSDKEAFARLSECYKLLYLCSRNEYHRHLSEEYRRAAIECLNWNF